METGMKGLARNISEWIRDYVDKNNLKCLVVGVSGGVDSTLVSTLCAMTNIKTVVISMPCKSKAENNDMADKQITWLCNNFPNVESMVVNLDAAFDGFVRELPSQYHSQLGFANTKSRLRMVTLYQVACTLGGIVVGTGNKVEDYGVGFFTKYGDGGVDIAPIADLLKSEVRQMAREIGCLPSHCEAVPNDGLWDDNRTDESQLGATYAELEWAMGYMGGTIPQLDNLTPRQLEVLNVYLRWNKAAQHKLMPIPTFRRSNS